jgi:hypothetical protein
MAPVPESSPRVVRDPKRLLLAGAGVVSVGVGAIGVVVPGLPTTVFLLIASYCFTRSCPWLEERLLRRPVFARYMRVIDGGAPMPRRARLVSLAAMWTSVTFSLALLQATGRLGPLIGVAIVLAAAIGTGFLVTARRTSRPVERG